MTVASAIADATGHSDAAQFGLTAAAALVLPLALTAYPRLDWRHPVDFIAVATIAGAGVLTVAQWSAVNVVATMGLVIAMVLIAHTWWRIERSAGNDRWALTWMALGVGVPGLAAGLASFAAPTTTGIVVAIAVFALVGPAMYVGVDRPEVVDVRGLVVHSVVFAFAAMVYVSIFMTLASLIEILSGSAPIVGAMAVIGLLAAVTFHPLQVMLRGVVDELLFGHRPDPLGAATTVVGQHRRRPGARAAGDPRGAGAPVCRPDRRRRTARRLRVRGHPHPHAGPRTRRRADAASWWSVCGPGDLRLSAGDEHVLRLVAPLLAQTLRASSLAADLQRSREADHHGP